MFGQQAAAASATETKRFSFSGSAMEYFGIWIVNLLLSIVTLGIYTAWAKVRRLRYFYGNTWLDDHNFEYHAKPMQILIGRIIVFGILVIVNVASNIYPLIAVFVIVPYMIALPWLLNKAISFNARMTSYRNVHFGFEGSYGTAFWVFVLLPLIIPIAFGILGFIGYQSGLISPINTPLIGILVLVALVAQIAIIPYLSKMVNEYIGNRTRYGAAKFSTDMDLTAIFKNLGIVLLIAGLPFLIIAGLFGAVYSSGGVSATGLGVWQIAIFIFYAVLIGGGVFYAAGVRNIAFNSTKLDGVHQLQSTLSRLKYSVIIITNFLAIIVSIGLLRPWTAVRTWRYLADNTGLQVSGTMDGFIAGQEQAGSVIAGEYLDIEGIDFGL